MLQQTISTMKVSILAALLAVVCALGGAHAQNGQIAILAPLEGRYGPLGKQISQAALSVLDAQSTQLIDTDCSAEGGLAAANSAVDQKISAVIGLPCIDAFDAAAPVLAKAGITIYAIGLQATNITSAPPRFIGDNWPVLRIGPIANMEAQILGTYLSQKWRGNPIALVDDGTLYGRQIAESVGVILEASENALIYRDSFRPLLDTQAALVRRLVRAQATRVVFGGDAADLAVVARDAQRLDADIAFAGGDPLFFRRTRCTRARRHNRGNTGQVTATHTYRRANRPAGGP